MSRTRAVMKVRYISDRIGSYVPQNETTGENEKAGEANGGATPQVSQQAEAFKLAADFGSSDPAEADKRAKRVQELKAQNEAGTLRPASSSAVAKKIIEELVI